MSETPRRIAETTTLAELQMLLQAFGLSMTIELGGASGRILVGLSGGGVDAVAGGSSIAEAAQQAFSRWCIDTGDALKKGTTP